MSENWSAISAGLRERNVPSPSYFRKILNTIGAPCQFEDFGLTRQDVRRTVAIAKDIRDRFTVLDLATDLGLLPDRAEDVLIRRLLNLAL